MAIGHVVPVSKRHEMVNPVFADFIAGAGEVYAPRGYDIRLTVMEDENVAAAYRRLASRGTVDGIILQWPRPEDPRVEILRRIGLPFVVHGRTGGGDDRLHWVDLDNHDAFLRATRHLTALGHRRIGLINGLEELTFARDRRSGYLAALAEAGIAPAPELMAADEMTETRGHGAAARMLALPQPPTALLVASMIPAIGVRRAIAGAGLTMGREVSVVIHDDDLGYLGNGTERPLFTATRSSVRKAGRACADLLLDIIASPLQKPRHILLEAELVPGGSSGPAPKGR